MNIEQQIADLKIEMFDKLAEKNQLAVDTQKAFDAKNEEYNQWFEAKNVEMMTLQGMLNKEQAEIDKTIAGEMEVAAAG